MKKLAVIQGSWAHPRTSITFKDLGARYEATMIAARKCGVVGETDMGMPVRRLTAVRDIVRHVPKLRNIFTWGEDQYLFGLEKALCDMDIVMAGSASCEFAYQAARYCEKTGKPFVLQALGNIPLHNVGNRLYSHRKYVLSAAKRIAALTERARMCLMLEGVDPRKIRVLRRGIDVVRFHPTAREQGKRESLGFKDEQVVALFAGRITWSKGIWDFVHAAKVAVDDLLARNLDIRFVIVGRGKELPLVKKRIEHLGLSDRFSIIESIPHDRMPAMYAAADMFVAPSIPTPDWQEQWGLVLSEAMATGTPVISAYSGCIPEVIGDAGILVQPADTFSLAKAMCDLASNAQLRKQLSEAGRARVEDLCDWRKVGSAYADLLDEALDSQL